MRGVGGCVCLGGGWGTEGGVPVRRVGGGRGGWGTEGGGWGGIVSSRWGRQALHSPPHPTPLPRSPSASPSPWGPLYGTEPLDPSRLRPLKATAVVCMLERRAGEELFRKHVENVVGAAVGGWLAAERRRAAAAQGGSSGGDGGGGGSGGGGRPWLLDTMSFLNELGRWVGGGWGLCLCGRGEVGGGGRVPRVRARVPRQRQRQQACVPAFVCAHGLPPTPPPLLSHK